MGATVPESAGLYFSWGNTDGHPAGADYDFSEEKYNSTPGAAITEDLTLNHDAARVNLGAPWRMPTISEVQELCDNCTCVWTTLNGVNGRLFTSNINGNKLFIPAAGVCNNKSLNARGTNGYYWSSTYYTDTNAHNMTFNNTIVNPANVSWRAAGFTVRAVQDGTPKRSIVPQTLGDNQTSEIQTVEETKDENEQ